MSQIIKDKNGKVLSISDTEYHEDGTGPRDASGALIMPEAASEDASGLSPDRVEEFKRQIFPGSPATTHDAAGCASSKSER